MNLLDFNQFSGEFGVTLVPFDALMH